VLVTLAVALSCSLAQGASTKEKAVKAHKKARAAAVRHDSAPDIVIYGRREDAMAFAAEVAAAHGLDRAWVEATLAGARYLPSVARLVMPPPAGTAKDWAAYRARFVEPQRISAGLAFWTEHEAWLAEAERRYGVPAEIIVGLIGVETYYGRLTGRFRVLDALATLSFDFPAGRKDRSAYFRSELAHLLVLAQRLGVEPGSIEGSYAGAMGLGQFMPGSILQYGTDFDADGRVDLVGSPADVIGSVGFYLASFGWKPGQSTHFAVQPPVDTASRATLLVPDILPTFTPAQMEEAGAVLDREGRGHDGPLALVELQNGAAAPTHVAGTQNFYVLTRYNWSAYYALAVIELGRAIGSLRPAPMPMAANAAAQAPGDPAAAPLPPVPAPAPVEPPSAAAAPGRTAPAAAPPAADEAAPAAMPPASAASGP
jgi:membrane-bound lytic murein transglycosylase B